MRVTRVFSTRVDENGRRYTKFVCSGPDDVQECLTVAPFGIDSNPTDDTRGVLSETGVMGDSVFMGVINVNQSAAVGEIRMFSVNTSNVVQTFVWLKNNGNILLGGDQKNLTRFQELESGFNQLKSDFNAHVINYNAHVHPAPGGATSPTASQSTQSTATIAGAKINYILTA